MSFRIFPVRQDLWIISIVIWIPTCQAISHWLPLVMKQKWLLLIHLFSTIQMVLGVHWTLNLCGGIIRVFVPLITFWKKVKTLIFMIYAMRRIMRLRWTGLIVISMKFVCYVRITISCWCVRMGMCLLRWMCWQRKKLILFHVLRRRKSLILLLVNVRKWRLSCPFLIPLWIMMLRVVPTRRPVVSRRELLWH